MALGVLRCNEAEHGARFGFETPASASRLLVHGYTMPFAFYRYCPTALLLGTWDSTGGEGLDSAKIPRAVVSTPWVCELAAVSIRSESRLNPQQFTGERMGAGR